MPWRFARTAAAAERHREEGAAETWDRMVLPEDVRRALRDGPRFGQRWRQLLRRLAAPPAAPRYRPPTARAVRPEPCPPPVRLQEADGPETTAIVPVPEVPVPAAVPHTHRRSELLALRFWPDGKPDSARALTCRRIHPPVPLPTASGLPVLPPIRLRRVGDRPGWAGPTAGADPVGTGPSGWRDRLMQLGRNRHTWFGAAALILLALVGYQTALEPRLGTKDQAWEAFQERDRPPELRGDAPAALEQHRRAAELDPTNPLLLYRLAQALEQHGEREQALATYRRAAALSLDAQPGARD